MPAIRFPHSVLVRVTGLLPMLYTPPELEEELKVPARTVRGWIPKGMPHQRDRRGHIWIDGRQFSEWVKTHHTPRRERQPHMASGEAYCLSCRRVVKLIEPVRHSEGRHVLMRGSCSACGRITHRGYPSDQPR